MCNGCCVMVCDVAVQSITAMRTIRSHQGQWCYEVGAIGPVLLSFPPVSNHYRSASQVLGFVQHVDRFLRRGIIHHSYRLLIFLGQVQKHLFKRRSMFSTWHR
ncbi:hypothetical protein TNCV_2443191 [Trichonephila clavipes]|nr:hypothetical protein TNCV_2443191 [Trichonephila clavipes]